MKLDRVELEKAGKLQRGALGDAGVEELRQLLVTYKERNAVQEVRPFWSPDDITPIQQQEPVALRVLVGAVWEVWREHGGRGHGGRWDKDELVHGAFIQLLQTLFEQADIKQPSARTLRRMLQSVREEDNRLRAEPVQVTDPDSVEFVWRKKT